MKNNFVNKVNIEGYVFSIEDNRGFNKLAKAETGPNSKNPGSPYIRGVVNIATDDEGLNVVPVYFTYVIPTYKNGNPNATYETLAEMIDMDAAGTLKTFVNSGTDAMKVRVDGDIELNDWLDREGNMVASKRVRGSFLHTVTAPFNPKATFEAEMLISNAATREVENGDDYMSLNGYVFNFRGDVLPISFSVNGEAGIKYFEDQDISSTNPLFTRIWGNMITNVIGSEKVVESAFGAPKVESTTRTLSAWNVDGCSTESLEFDSESTITKDELKQKLQERETRVQTEKMRQEQRRNNKSGAVSFNKSTKYVSPTASEDFAF